MRELSVVRTNRKTLSRITSKHRQLQDHPAFKPHFQAHIAAAYQNDDVNHDWTRYVVFYEVDQELRVYFRKYFIRAVGKDDEVSVALIEDLLGEVVRAIRTLSIALPIDYLYDILSELNLDNGPLLLKRPPSERIHMLFKLRGDGIQLIVKQHVLHECPIADFNKAQDTIYGEYLTAERSRRKILYLNQESTTFDCEDTVFDLQRFMYAHGYWLDITFNFNKNRFQNNACMPDKHDYFAKYDIFLFSNTNCLKGTLSGLQDGYIEQQMRGKTFVLVPYSYSFDNFKRLTSHRAWFDRIRVNNRLLVGCRRSDSREGITSLKSVTYTPHGSRAPQIAANELLNNKYNNYTDTLDRFQCDNLLPVCGDSNDCLLDKRDFFKIHHLDIGKPLVTFFTLWPIVIHDDNPIMYRFHFDNEFWADGGPAAELVRELRKDYNVIFKPHPGNMRVTEGTLSFNTEVYTEDRLKPILEFYERHKRVLGTAIVDYDYNLEVLKYTDFGIVTYGSTVCNELYVHNIPLLLLRSRRDDWIKLYSDAHHRLMDELLIREQRAQIASLIAQLEAKDAESKRWAIKFVRLLLRGSRKPSGKKRRWKRPARTADVRPTETPPKVFNVMDFVYGTSAYVEDIQENPALLRELISADHKPTFPHFRNNPLYGNTHRADQEAIGKALMDVLGEGWTESAT